VFKMSEQGAKYDADKLDWGLLPIGPIQQVIKVLQFGAKKYTAGGWMHVHDARRRYKNAAARHIMAMLDGEWLDTDSGMPHAAHAACNCLFLLWFGDDDE
jgi:hypothetical protein